MKNIIEMIRGFFKQHKELRKSRSIILALAAVVVFATTYALILPALTLDEDAAAETPGITVEGEALTGDAAEVTVDEQAAANAAAAEAAAEEQAAPEEPVAEAAVEEPAAEAVPEEAAPAETALAEAAAEEGQAAETQPSLDAETAETDGMQTETEEPKEEAALITEPTTLEVRGNGCTIRVAFDGTALLPVGVQLQVHEITKDNDPEAYQSYFDRSQAKVKEGQAPDTDTVLTYARFFDISFIDASGTEVEPSAAVDVRIVYDSDHAVDAGSGEDVGAVHFNEETNTTDEIKTENKPSGSDQDKVAEVGFQAENFSVYGVVGTQTLTAGVLTVDGSTYQVSVTYGVEAGIPEGATLKATEIPEGSELYWKYYNESLRELGIAPIELPVGTVDIVDTLYKYVTELQPNLPSARFFDISILYKGEKIEPKNSVDVKITYTNPLDLDKDKSLQTIHFASEGNEIIDSDLKLDAASSSMDFSVNSFSIFGNVVINEDEPEAYDGGSGTAEFSAVRAAAETEMGPVTTKSVTSNGDGTYKIRLDIVGAVETSTNVTNANVVIVFDRSGSMVPQRMNAAKTAVNNVASMLLGKNSTAHPDLVEMALISFSTKATVDIASTTRVDQFTAAVNNLSADGGTNWEDALQKVSGVTFNNDGDPTYVIFVSDGNPTFRNTRGNYGYLPQSDNPQWRNNTTYYNYRNDNIYYSQWGVYGLGSDNPNAVNYSPTSMQRCYDNALDEAQALVSSGRQFFTIGAFGNAGRMQDLTTGAGAPAENYYRADDSEALSAALEQIADVISNSIGYNNVATTDGVTSLSTVNAEVVDGSVTNFKYYRTIAGTQSAWTDAPAATIENNSVTWDLSSEKPLADGTTYSVEFDVWPSQASYDLVADLNNGLISYDALEQSVKDQIIVNTDGTYALRTNTSLNTTYTKNGTTATQVWDEGQYSMALNAVSMNLKKSWNNTVDERVEGEVTLIVTKDGEEYLSGEHALTLSEDNSWQSSDFDISCGLISLHEDGTYTIREKGHDYSVIEPEEYSYHWDLTAPTYRPMVINNRVHNLVKVTQYDKYDYIIDGNYYKDNGTGAISLTAVNDRRSNLNLLKQVVDKNDEDITGEAILDGFKFKYTLKVTSSDGEDVWFSVNDTIADQKIIELVTNATPEVKDGQKTGYYYAASGSDITVEMEAGWNLRFTNVLLGSTYSYEETDMPSDFGLVMIDGEEVTTDVFEGIVSESNKTYQTTYTNKLFAADIILKKIADDENESAISGAVFKLYRLNANGVYELVSDVTDADENGEFGVEAAGKSITGLISGTYKLEEVKAPDGYIISNKETIFNVKAGSDVTTVITLADGTTDAEVTGDNQEIITIINKEGLELPNTGGIGTLPYTLGGLMILGAAVMFGFILRRRRGRRLYE